ncbi:hypothetical protein COSO111634_09970 [Corallococcus soli]
MRVSRRGSGTSCQGDGCGVGMGGEATWGAAMPSSSAGIATRWVRDAGIGGGPTCEAWAPPSTSASSSSSSGGGGGTLRGSSSSSRPMCVGSSADSWSAKNSSTSRAKRSCRSPPTTFSPCSVSLSWASRSMAM